MRDADAARFRTLADLRGRRVATLGGTIAYEILLARRSASTASRRSRTTTTCIRTGSRCSAASMPCCSTTCSPSGASDACPGFTRAAGERRDRPLRRRPGAGATRRCAIASTTILRAAMRDGTLERDLPQVERLERRSAAALRARARRRADPAGRAARYAAAGVATMSRVDGGARVICPSLLRASVVTIVLSCLSMALAVVLGVLIASGRVYGDRAACALRSPATSS